jgi:predicted TIM-barrel fold metal-dependent hydrolase
MQDISMLTLGSVGGAPWTKFTDRAGRKATDLASWHGIIDSHFDRYGPYAVAVKTQVAYQRRLDFSDVPAEQAAGPFAKLLAKDPVGADERKLVEDHLFWYCVRKATAHSLPVKLHTGYYAGHGSMPLGRVMYDPADVSDLLRRAPETTFVLMHIGYPYQEPMIALAKHYHNAVLDLCWAWIINPAAATRFVEDFLMAAPANKLLTFGGDYVPVEPVVGHARLARRGLAQALERLAASGWVSRAEALELIEPLMRGNARRLFRLEEKERVLRRVPWLNQA